jgi:lysophospholipase L1-like esterase
MRSPFIDKSRHAAAGGDMNNRAMSRGNAMRCALSAAVLTILMAPAALSQQAQAANTHWVATWASAQQQPRSFRVRPADQPVGAPAATGARGGAGFGRGATGASGNPGGRPTPPLLSFHNQTIRMVVRTSLAGHRLRIHLANTHGLTPLVIGAAHVALHDKDSAILPASDRALSFNGKSSTTIPPGAEMISDAVALDAPALSELVVSVYAPDETGPASDHFSSFRTTWITKDGDLTGARELTGASTVEGWFWISAIDVEAPPDAATIVAFGDSITDGASSTVNADRTWPDMLAVRLQQNETTAHVGIVNEGIGGNRLLSDEFGVNGLARFDRDVLGIAGVRWVMLLEGINDLNFPPRSGPQVYRQATAEDLIGAMKQIVERAHAHNIKVIGCTLTPFGRATQFVEMQRQALNEFIRHGGVFDGVADFDQATRDPSSPMEFRAGFNNTDHLHPNDAGYKAMADAVDLSMFVHER